MGLTARELLSFARSYAAASFLRSSQRFRLHGGHGGVCERPLLGRKLAHTVRLIPPAYVKPFVKRQKNDMADAEASLAALSCAEEAAATLIRGARFLPD